MVTTGEILRRQVAAQAVHDKAAAMLLSRVERDMPRKDLFFFIPSRENVASFDEAAWARRLREVSAAKGLREVVDAQTIEVRGVDRGRDALKRALAEVDASFAASLASLEARLLLGISSESSTASADRDFTTLLRELDFRVVAEKDDGPFSRKMARLRETRANALARAKDKHDTKMSLEKERRDIKARLSEEEEEEEDLDREIASATARVQDLEIRIAELRRPRGGNTNSAGLSASDSEHDDTLEGIRACRQSLVDADAAFALDQSRALRAAYGNALAALQVALVAERVYHGARCRRLQADLDARDSQVALLHKARIASGRESSVSASLTSTTTTTTGDTLAGKIGEADKNLDDTLATEWRRLLAAEVAHLGHHRETAARRTRRRPSPGRKESDGPGLSAADRQVALQRELALLDAQLSQNKGLDAGIQRKLQARRATLEKNQYVATSTNENRNLSQREASAATTKVSRMAE